MDRTMGDDLQAWKIPTDFESRIIRKHNLPWGTESWKRVEMLGAGSCGEVWKEECVSGKSSFSSSIFRAVKCIPKRRVDFLHSSTREIKALALFSDDKVPEYQQHFVPIRGWFEDEANWYIAMEFVEYGSLQEHINKAPIPEPEAASITAQIARALLHIHTASLVHGALKPSNILVCRPGPQWHVKVADFGITSDLSDNQIATHDIGTADYMPPELFEPAHRYTSAVDLWALGAIVFCMRTQSPPFANVNIYEMGNYRNDPNLFPITPLKSSTEVCREFIIGAMAGMPEERLTIHEALGHYWLSRNMDQSARDMDLTLRPRRASSTASVSLNSFLELPTPDNWSSYTGGDDFDDSASRRTWISASTVVYGMQPEPTQTMEETREDVDGQIERLRQDIKELGHKIRYEGTTPQVKKEREERFRVLRRELQEKQEKTSPQEGRSQEEHSPSPPALPVKKEDVPPREWPGNEDLDRQIESLQQNIKELGHKIRCEGTTPRVKEEREERLRVLRRELQQKRREKNQRE